MQRVLAPGSCGYHLLRGPPQRCRSLIMPVRGCGKKLCGRNYVKGIKIKKQEPEDSYLKALYHAHVVLHEGSVR